MNRHPEETHQEKGQVHVHSPAGAAEGDLVKLVTTDLT